MYVAFEHLYTKKQEKFNMPVLSPLLKQCTNEIDTLIKKNMWIYNTQPPHTINAVQFTFWFACNITLNPIIYAFTSF